MASHLYFRAKSQFVCAVSHSHAVDIFGFYVMHLYLFETKALQNSKNIIIDRILVEEENKCIASSGASVAANLYFREYVPMGIDSLRFHSESIPMGTF